MPNDVIEQRQSRLPRFLGRKASRPVRVLAIDGGGIRGILAAMVLAEFMASGELDEVGGGDAMGPESIELAVVDQVVHVATEHQALAEEGV